MTDSRRLGVVGGGILGTTLALRLTEAGHQVTLLEGAAALGGLAGTMDFGGHRVDRFYHVVVPSDERMIELIESLGLGDELRFSPVGVGFWIDGALHPLDSVRDFVGFRPLSVAARGRLAWFIAQCQLRSGFAGLEDLSLERWLRRHCGREVVDRIWRPLLDSRFDGRWEELPATYLWARTRRMSSARSGRSGGGERMGHVRGGHQRLIERVATRASELGAQLRFGARVTALERSPAGAVTGVRLGEERLAFDQTVITLQPPALAGLLVDDLRELLRPYPVRFLGVVCLVLKVRRSLLPCYSVNICAPTPVTTVVESSHVVGTDHTDGLRLIYVPKYCEAGSAAFAQSDDEVRERFADMVGRICPGFSWQRDVVDWTVQRAPLVEPVHALGTQPRTAPIWPGVDGLALASASQVYPRLLNGESIVGLAEGVAAEMVQRLAAQAS